MNENPFMNQSVPRSGAYYETVGQYTAKTFAWMFAGLMLTFGVAVSAVLSNTILYLLVYVPYWYYIAFIAELVVVIYLSARIERMSVGTAKALFFLYSILNGLVFSTYFVIFQLGSLMLTFGVTALFFGVMALFGYFGKIDFSRLRSFMMAGLIFLAGFWILSLFIDLTAFERMVCTAGIFLFLVFTAYDTKKIQAYHAYYGQMPEMAAKASIFSALQLYLDFINLFLYILRFAGRRRN